MSDKQCEVQTNYTIIEIRTSFLHYVFRILIHTVCDTFFVDFIEKYDNAIY